MENNKNQIFFTISGVIAIIAGILYSITIIGLIIGIPLLIASKHFFNWSKQTDDEIIEEKQTLLIWAIVLAIFTFPFGLIALIPVFNLKGELANMIKPQEKPASSVEEKLNKLADLKEKGLIDEEEYKAAKAKVINE